MIQLIPIMPKNYLYKFYKENAAECNKCIVMAHLLLEDQTYIQWVRNQKESGKYIILDNSAPYFDKAIDNASLLKCIELIQPDEIVLPDVINNFKETVQRTLSFIDLIKEKQNLKLMAVPQGNSIEEYKKCYQLFSTHEKIDIIGISYTVDNLFVDKEVPSKYITSREYLLNLLYDQKIINHVKEHHLLGLGNSGNLELKKLSKFHFITRCDSNAAYIHAKCNVTIDLNIPYKKKKIKINFDDSFNELIYSFMLQNLKTLENGEMPLLRRPTFITDTSQHTMGNHLEKYLEIKMHNHVSDKTFDKIIVIGEYDRSVDISLYEKKDKKFNWQRPTAEIKNNQLFIKCPPGKDYVSHYGSLIATYLAIKQRKFDHVYYIEPSNDLCNQLMDASNLKMIPLNKTVIVGYGLDIIAGEENWQENGPFLYKPTQIFNKDVTFIGCKYSIWGDIAGKFVQSLSKLGVKQVIYIGKLGSLNDDLIPNEHLATGNVSNVEGTMITWKNLFTMNDKSFVKFGRHYTSPSTICETKEWLENNKKFDFVDPEIGHMAKAANESNIDFSYLHIISNNLTKILSENLSNERLQTITSKRRKLLIRIKSILEDTFRSP